MSNGPEAYQKMMQTRLANKNPTGIYDNPYYGKFKVVLRYGVVLLSDLLIYMRCILVKLLVLILCSRYVVSVTRGDNLKEPEMSWIPSAAAAYSGKPTVTTQSTTLIRYTVLLSIDSCGGLTNAVCHHRGDGYVEVDIDSRCFGFLSNTVTPVLLRNMHHSVNSVLFCIESTKEEELPECAFGCAQMVRYNLNKIVSYAYDDKQ